jgi:phasin family protein
MLTSTNEQFSAAARHQIESQLIFTTALTEKMMESVEKMMGLSLQTAKSALETSVANAHNILSAKDAQEFFGLSATQAQPQAEMVMAYGRELASIATSAQNDITKATETQMAENNRKLVSLFDEAKKMAPAGSENLIDMLKSAMGNAQSGYEQMTKTSKMAVEAMESNMNTAASQMTQAAAKVGARSKK